MKADLFNANQVLILSPLSVNNVTVGFYLMTYLSSGSTGWDGGGELTSVDIAKREGIEGSTPLGDLRVKVWRYSNCCIHSVEAAVTLNQLAPLPSQAAAVLGAFPRYIAAGPKW
jgi:hypothetical protein